jgi:hypothetical protein
MVSARSSSSAWTGRRYLMVQEAALSYFLQHGFTIVRVMDPDLVANDPRRIPFGQMMGVFAQYDKSMVVLKLAGARARKCDREGRCEGRKPFGYYRGEAAALERIQTLKKEGLGFDRIAAQLNADGIPTRTGRPWQGSLSTGSSLARRSRICTLSSKRRSYEFLTGCCYGLF